MTALFLFSDTRRDLHGQCQWLQQMQSGRDHHRVLQAGDRRRTGSRKDGRQTAKGGVAVHVLNRMLELGCPISVSTSHEFRGGWGCRDPFVNPRNNATPGRGSGGVVLSCHRWVKRNNRMGR
jgi:hypothetical protein